ncbi:hypothetical protein SGRA_0661 [Saprospira grandis str. Lewin]|uniref:Uncharacterized protein n=1 Tax=Saprospira grandis (strain Lewin) TaxID=984262 RepID=H6L0H0_SAPGL|nr:hypothetical protein SGRA_0661 [Saprospira grandis str. Lewin]
MAAGFNLQPQLAGGEAAAGKGQMKALPLLSFALISCYSALFFSAIATAMPLKNALTSLKFLSKDGRSAELPFGLGACKGAAQRQTQPACWRRAEQTCEPCKGPAAVGGRPQKHPQKTMNMMKSAIWFEIARSRLRR